MLVNGIKTLLVSASDSGGIISNNIDNISMLITISKSGETQKVLEKMQLANDHQIPTVLFCGNGEHRAHQLANFLLVSLMNDHMIRRTSNIRVFTESFYC